jgi:SecD/SecF fusion protein
MNKKPVLFRIIIAVIVIAVFASSIYPLKPLDFYSTLLDLSSNKDKKLEQTITLAKKIEKEKKVFPSVAVEKASRKMGLDLANYITLKGATGNKDVIAFVKQQASSSIRLGLDLNGGVEFLLEIEHDAKKLLQENKSEISSDQQRDIAIEVLRNRLERENIFESEISPVGDKYISLKVPTTSKEEIESLGKILSMSARLEFKLVHKENRKLVGDFLRNPENFQIPDGYVIMEMPKTDSKETQQQLTCIVKKRPEMRGDNITEAGSRMDAFGQRYISLTFGVSGAEKFGKVTTEYVGRQLGIVLDGTLYSAPNLNEPILGGQAKISGKFSREETERISKALMSGNLPKIRIEAMFETDPTLGAEAVRTGTMAGLYGLIAVVVFMLVYYMRAGLVANLALLANIVLIMGFMATFQATLTLPGIAGIILTIGMAVDANVLIFERIREELEKSKNLMTAIDTGYRRAFITIFDSNITTLFVALILMWQGTGPIKGFAVTLSIGIITSMFTSLFLTRLAFDLMGRTFNFKTMPMLKFFAHPKINFLSMKNVAFTVSAILIIVTIVTGGIQGKDVLSIDFTGGTRLTFDYNADADKPLDQAEVTKLLNAKGFDAKVSQKTNLIGDKQSKKLEIVLRRQNESKDQNSAGFKAEIARILNAKFPSAELSNGSETSIGALIGWQFTKSAIVAIIMAIIGIIIYISLRFEFAFAIAAVIAIIHDITIATGLFMLSKYILPSSSGELSLPVIAALLTIMGYSLNDTIVVFDRIREDLGLVENKSYKAIINLSINQTLSRTVLTSLTTLIVLVTLYATGVVAISDFVLVMIIGIIVGTYSSIFVASPIVSVWHKRIGAKLKE